MFIDIVSRRDSSFHAVYCEYIIFFGISHSQFSVTFGAGPAVMLLLLS